MVIRISQPTVISTFSGCGGSSLGYKLAGYKELLAIDFDKNSCETFALNFPDVPVWQRDISTVTAKEIMDFLHIQKVELDVLDGSPPCQGFSTAGKREVNDLRNDLFKEFCRLLTDLQPKVFVMENVSGMVKGTMKGKFIEIMKTLKQCGYKVRCKLLNAMNYDVPQSRQRLFFIGIRNNLDFEPVFPTPNTNIIPVKKALENVNISFTPPLDDKYGQLWSKIKPGKNAASILNKGQNSCVKLHPNKPSCTLPKMQGGRGFATIVHYDEPRAISINEAKRLSSFPDDFKFIGSYQEQWARIGNAVMPNQMKAIANTLKSEIFDKMEQK